MLLNEWLLDQEIILDLKDAEGFLLTGDVLVNDKVVTSPYYRIRLKDEIRLRNQKKWVARSGEKLEFALNYFKFNPENKVVLDAGASTGGFTEVLLKHSALKVYSVDVAYGFLHPSLRSNPRVKVMERTHICNLSETAFDPRPDYFVADLSFISIKKVLLCMKKLFSPWEGIILYKPQFEVKPEDLENGIVKSQDILDRSILDFKVFLDDNRISYDDEIPSPIKGRKGNTEYLFHLWW